METIVTRYVTDATAATSATSNITFFVAFFVSTPATNSSSSCSSKSLVDPENFAVDVALTLSSFFDSFFFKSSGERSLPSSLRAPFSRRARSRARASSRARVVPDAHERHRSFAARASFDASRRRSSTSDARARRRTRGGVGRDSTRAHRAAHRRVAS
jgi:hypothetical protein